MKLRNEKLRNEYPLADLLNRGSLDFLKKITGKNYGRTKRKKTKITATNNSITTFELKLLMEEVPKGELYGR